MKSFKQYLEESRKKYEFRLKIAKKPSDDEMDRLEKFLRQKYDAIDIGTPKKVNVEKNPRDFRSIGVKDVYMIDFVTERSMGPAMMKAEISQKTGIHERHLELRGKNEPLHVEDEEEGEDRLEPEDKKKYKSKLLDSDYSDAPKIDLDDYFGEGFKERFLNRESDRTIGSGYEGE